MKNFEPDFANRLSTAADAKKARMKKVKKINPANDPKFAERQAAKLKLSIEREARRAERKAAKLAEEARKAEEKAAEERRKAEEQAAEELRLEEEAKAEADRAVALLAEQKAARDARYSARKARQKKGRR